MTGIIYFIAIISIIIGIVGMISKSSKRKEILPPDTLHPTNPNLKFCRHCNNEVAVTAITCPKCGGNVSNDQIGSSTSEEIISFLIPIVGFIIYANNSTSNPVKAKKVLTAAFWGLGFGIFFYILLMMIK